MLPRTWFGYPAYLSCPSRCPAATRGRHGGDIFISGFGQEWNRHRERIGTNSKSIAGTGQVVGFARYWVPNPGDPSGNPHHSLEVTVHADHDVASPDAYPLPNLKGIVKHGQATLTSIRSQRSFRKRCGVDCQPSGLAIFSTHQTHVFPSRADKQRLVRRATVDDVANRVALFQINPLREHRQHPQNPIDRTQLDVA